MGLSFHYEFTAPADTPAVKLEAFLREVEIEAKSLGFDPTIVLNAPFDTPERREFARRLGASFTLEDEHLKGIAIPAPNQIRDHDPVRGTCRLIPERGVVLVVTDEQACETCFGFFKFPTQVLDIHGAVLTDTGLEGRWAFRDFVDTPDPRFRAIVGCFKAAGFAKEIRDEYA